MLAVVFDFLLKPPLVQSALETGYDGTFPGRFDKIVVRARAHRLYANVHIIHTGGDQERHVRKAATNLHEELHPAKARHVKIGNDRVEGLTL